MNVCGNIIGKDIVAVLTVNTFYPSLKQGKERERERDRQTNRRAVRLTKREREREREIDFSNVRY